MKSIITKIRRKKMAEASHTGNLAKITHIALGTGGVDTQGEVIDPLSENNQLNNEVLRKAYTTSERISDTCYAYSVFLGTEELVGTHISELALIDEDGDVAAFLNFLPKGKDETEVSFTIEDIY